MTTSVPRVAPDGRDVVRFPFSAVVGHDDLRLALLLNAVHPGVGGVLVRGEKGTAKSTAVRALAALLPDVAVVPGLPVLLRPGRPGPALPRRAARRPRTGHGVSATTRARRRGAQAGRPGAARDAALQRARPRRPAGRAARRRHRGPAGRVAGPGARAGRGRPRLPARAARRGAPRACSTSTRSTCCTTTSSTCCWTPPRWAARTSSGTGCRCRTPRRSCWSAR